MFRQFFQTRGAGGEARCGFVYVSRGPHARLMPRAFRVSSEFWIFGFAAARPVGSAWLFAAGWLLSMPTCRSCDIKTELATQNDSGLCMRASRKSKIRSRLEMREARGERAGRAKCKQSRSALPLQRRASARGARPFPTVAAALKYMKKLFFAFP